MGTSDTFKSNCTLPPEGVNFVSSPNARGTLDIVWSCISILLLCTYSVLHLNVPIQSSPETKREKICQVFFRTLDKAGWMLLNLVAPELPLAKAWSDYRSAKIAHAKLKRWAEVDGVDWSLTHTHFANMGGFMVKFRQSASEELTAPHAMWSQEAEMRQSSDQTSKSLAIGSRQQAAVEPEESDSELANLDARPVSDVSASRTEQGGSSLSFIFVEAFDTLASDKASRALHGFEQSVRAWSCRIGSIDWKVDQYNLNLVEDALDSVRRYRFATKGEQRRFGSIWPSWYRNLRALQGDVWLVDAHQLCLARELDIIGRLPAVAEDDLNDRNKGDTPVLLVALGQIGWFVLQLLVRVSQQKATSQLEIMTFSFAVVTAITYSLLWNKPKGLTYSIAIPAKHHAKTPGDLTRLALLGPSALFPSKYATAALINNGHSSQRHPHPFGANAFINYVNSLCISDFNIHIDHDLERASASSATHVLAASGLSLSCFGALHLIALEFVFPTSYERWLWFASSMVTIVAPFYAILFHLITRRRRGALFEKLSGSDRRVWLSEGRIFQILFYVVVGFYFLLARGFILVEVFRSLAFLSPGAFETSWPANLPHIG